MKRRIALITAMCLLIGYIGWVLVPFDESIRVYDEVGITKSQQDAIVEYAKSIGSFRKSTIENLKSESRFTPWSRGELFVSISGTQAEVEVMAGFYGGPLYGGGKIFTAKWIDGAWVFTDKEGMMWIS
jgi:hypothetical protein